MTTQNKMVFCIIILAITNLILTFEIRSMKKDDLLISDYVVSNYNESVDLDGKLLDRMIKNEEILKLLVDTDSLTVEMFKKYHEKK